MAHGEAEQGRAEGEQPCLLGDQQQQPATGPPAKPLRWACGTGSYLVDGAPVVPAGEEDVAGGLVPRQRSGEPEPDEDPEPGGGPTCQPDRPGWAGAHRHGAVRPRRRVNRQERPPRRWC
jgi:hypothetical protein